MTDASEIELEMANRLYLADLDIAERTLARTQEALAAQQRIVDEAASRVREIRDGGVQAYLDKVR